MADVRRDRGQLILVTGFALAFTLVAVVLLLNTVIYTENIASRGIDRSADEALEFRDAAIEGLGDTLIATNHNRSDGAPVTVLNDTAKSLTEIFTRIHTEEGTVAELDPSTLSTRPGTVLQQSDSSREFTSEGGAAVSWDLAADVNATRNARFTVHRSALDTATHFQVQLDGDTETWTVHIYEDASGNISLATESSLLSFDKKCSVDAATAEIHLTGDGIVGRDCGDYQWAASIDSNYTITFINGDNAAGTYNITINDDGPTSVNSGAFNGATGSSPREIDAAVYSATIRVRYETPTFLYESTVRIAPGEPDDD